MTDVKCFLLKPTMKARAWLRCYRDGDCALSLHGYHNVKNGIEDIDLIASATPGVIEPLHGLRHDPNDARWPSECACGMSFMERDRHLFYRQLYEAPDGQQYTIEDAPVGAMWFADWMKGMYCGPDGRALYVMTPGGEWLIDGKANNCTMPDDSVHKCWVRHGEAPDITVDKNGHTCAAGAGSIAIGNYHGFLQNGYLTCCP